MKIVYIGCVKTSEIFLEKLVSLRAEIVGVITKKSSSFNADFVNLSAIALKNNIDFIYSNNVNDEQSVNFIHSKKPDVIFCFGWSQLLNKTVLTIPRLGVMGFHPAELPQNRGRHPIIWALALGLSQTASTFLILDENADTGSIVSQEIIPICYEDDAQSLYDKILRAGCMQVEDILLGLSDKQRNYIVQNSKNANIWRKRNKNDGKIDWRMSGFAIYNLVRALTKPYVGAHFVYRGVDYKVWKSKEYKNRDWKNIEPGKVMKVFSKTHFIIMSGQDAVEVLDSDPVELMENDYLME